MKRIEILSFLLFVVALLPRAQVSSDWEKDTELLEAFIRSTPKVQVDSAMLLSALSLLNSPYEAGTLEGEEEETLVVDLRTFDCVTFVESCLALSRSLQYQSPDMDYYERELRSIRYRNGRIDGYASRLHYMTDWIFDKVKMGIVEDISHALGGYRLKMNLFYMSQNSSKYPGLKDAGTVARIAAAEKEINSRNYFYIPKQEIVSHQSSIRNGDILCFTTSIAGLDISHVGIAYWYKNQLTFIHASPTAKKVIINPESLADYCVKIGHNIGIIVLRPVAYSPQLSS